MSRGSVLIVDDEPKQLEILRTILAHEGYDVEICRTAEEAVPLLRASPPQILLTDLKLPGMDGIALLEEAVREAPGCCTIMMTAHGTVDTAVRAMKRGAFDYLTKPLDRDELLLVLERAMETVRLRGENRSLRAQLHDRFRLENVVGDHGLMQDVFRLVQKVASSSATVLIYGESGTGKELIARALHYNSPRAARPFVAVNCSAIPEPLLESELFGHEKGAFTGAVARKAGLFEEAQGGTLFLDEVGDLPLAMQAKLLRAVQEKEIRRVGGTASIPLDVRIVAATNQDLARLVREGKFREDLYYRLNVFPITLPPLRERATDIPRLAEHFLERFAREAGRSRPRVSRQALSLLLRYRWPGNVRQLESVLERAFLLCEGGEITPDLLPPEVRENVAGPPSGLDIDIPDEGISLEALERELLAKAMRKAGGRLTRAARLLGISYRTLQYRLEKFGIARQPVAGPPNPSGAPPEPDGVEPGEPAR